jgi:hypothetical protein
MVDIDKMRERNRERINMVGSSGNPSPEATPLGTVIEVEPEWVCCCCDQDIPRPSAGMSTAVGSFCGPCFLAYMKHLFNGTPAPFLNQIREESHRFIEHRRNLIEDGIEKPPRLEALVTIKSLRERLNAEILKLADMLSDYGLTEEESKLWGIVEGLKRAYEWTGKSWEPPERG